MTDDRPEWVTCVAINKFNITWCGHCTPEFKFQNWEHAIGNAVNAGRLTVCPDCLRAVVDLLEKQ